jgi:hypothetical protein
MQNLRGDDPKARFLAGTVKRADQDMTRKIAAKDSGFVFQPDGEVIAVAPDEYCASHAN